MVKKTMANKSKRSQKYKVYEYTRCERYGRPHLVLHKYKLCRICLRELAYKGQIPGVKKASWQSDRKNTVMIMMDLVADILIKVRNVLQARHETVEISVDKEEVEIVKILKNKGFITDYTVDGDIKETIIVTLKYGPNNEKVINGSKRISRPGLRVYAKVDSTPRVMNGLGIAIISTSHGVITDKEVKAKHVGSEIIAYVW